MDAAGETLLRNDGNMSGEVVATQEQLSASPLTHIQMPECPICLSAYDSREHCPRVLTSCGHTVCSECIATMSTTSGTSSTSSSTSFVSTVIRCPECNERTRVAIERDLPKNIELMRLIDSILNSESLVVVQGGKKKKSKRNSERKRRGINEDERMMQLIQELKLNGGSEIPNKGQDIQKNEDVLQIQKEEEEEEEEKDLKVVQLSEEVQKKENISDHLDEPEGIEECEEEMSDEDEASDHPNDELELASSIENNKYPCHVEIFSTKAHFDHVSDMIIVDQFLFTSSFDKSIKMWLIEPQQVSILSTLRDHDHRVTALAKPDTEDYFVSGDISGKVIVWKVPDQSHQPTSQLTSWKEEVDWKYFGILSLAVSKNREVFTGNGDKTIKVFSIQSQKLLSTMHGHDSAVSCLALDDGILYSGDWSGCVRLWWCEDYSPLCVLKNLSPSFIPCRSLAIYEKRLFVAKADGSLEIWENNMCELSLKDFENEIMSITIGDGFLYCGGNDKIKVYSVDWFKQPVITIHSHSHPITCLDYDKNRNKLFSAFMDGTLKVWNST